MGDAPKLKFYLFDAAPLITLAAAKALDYLSYPSAPVIVPDAVWYEATDDAAKLGAADLISWKQAHPGGVEIMPTHAFQNFQTLKALRPEARQPDLGEIAALEIVRAAPTAPDERIVIIAEDSEVLRGKIVAFDPTKTIVISTRDFLTGLELAQRINSAQAVYDAAAQAGRTPSQAELLPRLPEEARSAIVSDLKGDRDGL